MAITVRAAGVRLDDLYMDHGLSGELDKALEALHSDDTLVIAALSRLGKSAKKMLDLVDELRTRNIGLRVLNLGEDDIDTKTPIILWFFTVTAALV